MPFPGLWGSFDRILMVRKQRFSMSKFTNLLYNLVVLNGRRRILLINYNIGEVAGKYG
jgi:hypothetical protein